MSRTDGPTFLIICVIAVLVILNTNTKARSSEIADVQQAVDAIQTAIATPEAGGTQ